jgi:hypothetical protein
VGAGEVGGRARAARRRGGRRSAVAVAEAEAAARAVAAEAVVAEAEAVAEAVAVAEAEAEAAAEAAAAAEAVAVAVARLLLALVRAPALGARAEGGGALEPGRDRVALGLEELGDGAAVAGGVAGEEAKGRQVARSCGAGREPAAAAVRRGGIRARRRARRREQR